MNLDFKTEKVFKNFTSKPMHDILSEVFYWWCDTFYDVVVTSAYRKGDTGVHGTIPFRGIDIRSWIYPAPEKKVEWANSKWIYDPYRPQMKCFILHNAGKKWNMHIHIQACDLTHGRDI